MNTQALFSAASLLSVENSVLFCFAIIPNLTSNTNGKSKKLPLFFGDIASFSPRYKSQKAAPKDGNIWEPDKSPEKENRQ